MNSDSSRMRPRRDPTSPRAGSEIPLDNLLGAKFRDARGVVPEQPFEHARSVFTQVGRARLGRTCDAGRLERRPWYDQLIEVRMSRMENHLALFEMRDMRDLGHGRDRRARNVGE